MPFKFILFDLDDTLYPRNSGLMKELGQRIQIWLCNQLGLTPEEGFTMRRGYYHRYGTTLGGLVAEQAVEDRDPQFPRHDHRVAVRVAGVSGYDHQVGLPLSKEVSEEDVVRGEVTMVGVNARMRDRVLN